MSDFFVHQDHLLHLLGVRAVFEIILFPILINP
jgi:hypothetical protein